MKRLLSIGIILLFIGLSISTISGFNTNLSVRLISSGNTLYVGGSGPNNYTKIQDAIDDAFKGDTIFVFNGRYNENVIINKSIYLIGENRTDTIINALSKSPAIYVKSSWVNISSFTISKGSYGIFLRSGFIEIYDNYIYSNNYCGLEITNSNNLVINNVIYANENCIMLNWASNNTFKGNTISYSGGIFLKSSCNNSIIDNNFRSGGINLNSSSNYNTIKENIIEKSGKGICIGSSSDHNIITNNIILNNGDGIKFDFSCINNTIKNNNISENNHGIFINSIDSNQIIGNNFSKNKYCGIYLDSSKNLIIKNNSFINDGLKVYNSFKNTIINNTINGKPLVYLQNNYDMVINECGQIILINCDNVTIHNLEFTKNCCPISLWDSNNCLISDNNITDVRTSIYIYNSNSNNINRNNFIDNLYGINILNSENNSIKNNTISYMGSDGIGLSSSRNNTIIGNHIISNGRWGIHLSSSSRFNNIIENNISKNYEGIHLAFSGKNNIIGNSLWYNTDGQIGDGINIHMCGHNNISLNTISKNYHGICLCYSKKNIITKNIIQNHNIKDGFRGPGFGILLDILSNKNKIKKNNFIGNQYHAFLQFSHRNFFKENYWDNWIGLKTNKTIFQMFPKIIKGGFIPLYEYPTKSSFPLDFDWIPAKEPYDIEV